MRAEHWEEAEKCLILAMGYIEGNISEYAKSRSEGVCSVKDRILLDGMRADLERVRNSILQIRDDKTLLK